MLRWPIRNQILLPFVAVQVLTVCGIAAATSWMAVRTVEEQIQLRLSNVVSTLQDASFPLTPGILERMRSLSGAHFVVLSQDLQVSSSTMADVPELAEELSPAEWERLDAQVLERHQTLVLGGERYFAGRIRWRGPSGGDYVLVLYRHVDWRSARRQAMYPPLAIGGLLLIVTVTASVIVARRLERRIQRLQQQVQRIAGGDFAPTPPPKTDDELRDLSASVNQMAEMLERALQTVRETERSELLSQLVGGLAHQLRNAITGARISVQLHQRRCPKAGDDALKVALQQLALVEGQVRSLLRVTRGEQRTLVAEDLEPILSETVALVRPMCEHQRITLDYVPPRQPWQLADADGMRAAVLNLVMNSIEACGPGGTVRLSAGVAGGEMRVEVADNGPGLAHEQEIFRPFYSTKKEGIGLGLALARKAVEDVGGTLTAERLGPETVFRIVLPPATTTVPAAESASPAALAGAKDSK